MGSIGEVPPQYSPFFGYLLDDAYTDFILSRQAMLCTAWRMRF